MHATDTELHHDLEVRWAIHRLARQGDWPACCRAWLTGRLLGDLTHPVIRHPADGRPLCPRCARRIAADGARLAA